MTTLYKLTDKHDQTYGGTQWGPGITHTASGPGLSLCTSDLIHAYTHPLLAVLLSPIHADFIDPHLWESEGEVVATDYGLKVGCKTLTTQRLMSLPVLTLTQHIAFGILCAKAVYSEKQWNTWADGWLSGSDRSPEAARVAWRAAREWAAARVASWAASSAWTMPRAAWMAPRAVWIAAWTAGKVAETVVRAVNRRDSLDLIAIVQQATHVADGKRRRTRQTKSVA